MSTDTEQRVQRVINGLLPSTALIDRFGPPNNLSQRMEYFNTPGVSIAVIDDFKVDWIQGFGVCDVSSNQPVTGETLFQAGSISKAIFAVAVMRLVQDGVLDLDVDVNQYLTSWQVPGNDQWQAKVTMRDLLSHTAGMNVHGFPGYLPSEAVPSVPQILNGQPPANSPRVEVNILPGTQFRYSGGGYVVAQQVVVDLLGKPFAQVMDELVFRTLRLTHSTYAQPLDERWAPNRATAHASKSMPVAGGAHIYPELAAAGLWSTAGDLAQVGVELLDLGLGVDLQGRLALLGLELERDPLLVLQDRRLGRLVLLAEDQGTTVGGVAGTGGDGESQHGTEHDAGPGKACGHGHG